MYSRSAYRLGIYEKSFLWGALGFRIGVESAETRRQWVNGGVIRGAGLGYAYAFRTRAGFRLIGYNFKYSSVSDLGFR